MAHLVKRAGGEVILIIKENTPATRADLELFFEDPQADGAAGRCTKRWGKAMAGWSDVTSPPVLIESDYLRLDWGEVGQVFRVERERTSKDKQSRQVVYGLATLPQQVR